MDRPTPAGDGRIGIMRNDERQLTKGSELGFVRFAFAALAFAALTLFGGVGFADDEPAEAPTAAAPEGANKYAGCWDPKANPNQDPSLCKVEKAGMPTDTSGSSGSSDLASKLANPSAPVMALNSFLDLKQNGGSAPGAHRASFVYNFQPAIPFPTKRGNVILRPLIPVQFGEPYVTGAGNVETAVAFGNILLDTFYGKTLKSGFMVMGGFSTLFPTNSKPELRADWALGPEVVIGFASNKTGNVWGTITQFTWSFPTRAEGQTVAGQYFYGINLGKGYQINANPVWSYSRETKVLRFPLSARRISRSRLAYRFGATHHHPMAVGRNGCCASRSPRSCHSRGRSNLERSSKKRNNFHEDVC